MEKHTYKVVVFTIDCSTLGPVVNVERWWQLETLEVLEGSIEDG